MAGLIVVDASVLYEVITAGPLAREAAPPSRRQRITWHPRSSMWRSPA